MAISPLKIICSTVFEALENIAYVLNIQKDILIRSETLSECSFARSCSTKVFTENFSQERLKAWYVALGSDLIIDIFVEERNTSANISFQDRSGLDRIIEFTDTYEIDEVEVRITLKKESLKAQIQELLHLPTLDALFFFERVFVDSITLKGVQDMQKEGMFLADQYTFIAVLTGSGLLQGPLMTVFGQNSSIEDFSHLPKLKPILRAWNTARSLRDTNTVWAAPLSDISPDTFQMTQIRPGLESTYEAMRGVCNVLSLLQFCVSVLEDGEKWHVSIARLGGPVIDVASNYPYRDNSKSVLSPSLYRLFRWAFLAESFDKVDIVRELLQHEIDDRKDNSLQNLLASGLVLLEGARSNYKILRRKAFESYLHSRQEALEAVQNFVSSTRKDLDALRKGVLDTTLQFSIGIIAFLAAIVQFNLSKIVITVGFCLGLFYLILAAFFQLLPLWQQFRTQFDAARKAVDIHSELTLAERNRLFEQLPRGTWNSFTWWFLAGSAVYLLWVAIFIGFLIFLNFNAYGASHQNHSLPTHLIATPLPTHPTSKGTPSH